MCQEQTLVQNFICRQVGILNSFWVQNFIKPTLVLIGSAVQVRLITFLLFKEQRGFKGYFSFFVIKTGFGLKTR